MEFWRTEPTAVGHHPAAAAAMAPQALHADNGLSKSLQDPGLPGYDAAENDRPTREAQSGPSSAVNMSGAPEMPQAGGGTAGREP